MFGFDSTPRSVALDWSYFGGAEEIPPWLRKVAKRTSTAVTVPRQHSKPARGGFSSSETGSTTESASTSSRSSSCSSSTAGTNSSNSSSTIASDDERGDRDLPLSFEGDVAMKSRLSPASTSPTSAPAIATDGTAWLPKVSEQDPSHDPDFLWLLTEEPHRSRRQAIMKAHPEVKTLMGREPLTKWVSIGVVIVQLLTAYTAWRLQWHPLSWRFLTAAYVIGGTANQNIFLAIHEITHNLAFKGIKANKAWAVLVNSVIGVPYAMMFKQYHIEHHKYLGEDGVDTDVPTRLELMCLKNVLGKAFFATFQIFFYAFRPGFIKTQRLTIWHVLNITLQILFDALLVYFSRSWTPLLYLLFSSFFAGSLHPCAAHFIAEHYLFGGIAQETWSYYGPLNILAYNVGYHNEHHDFPSIPWTRLPALRAMAPEFYDCLPCHTSWPMVTVQFILGTDSGLWARIKRKGKGVPREMNEVDRGDVQGHELREKIV